MGGGHLKWTNQPNTPTGSSTISLMAQTNQLLLQQEVLPCHTWFKSRREKTSSLFFHGFGARQERPISREIPEESWLEVAFVFLRQKSRIAVFHRAQRPRRLGKQKPLKLTAEFRFPLPWTNRLRGRSLADHLLRSPPKIPPFQLVSISSPLLRPRTDWTSREADRWQRTSAWQKPSCGCRGNANLPRTTHLTVKSIYFPFDASELLCSGERKAV